MSPGLPSAPSLDHARASDIPDIMRLESAGFHAGIREEEAVFRDRLEVFPAGFVVLREEGSGRPRGYLCAERWHAIPPVAAESYSLGHDPRPRHAEAGEVLYIASMTVDPGLRGGGQGARLFEEGRALVRAAAARAAAASGGEGPRIRAEVLIVNEDWEGARRIYARAGFRETASIPAFFAAPEGGSRAAIVMELHHPAPSAFAGG